MESNMGLLRKTRGLSNMAVVVAVILSLEIVSANPLAQNGCLCDRIGANRTFCDGSAVWCECRPEYTGAYCSECSAGFSRLSPTEECIPCNCNEFGSDSPVCDNRTGDCFCKPGVGGAKCSTCQNDAHWWDGRQCSSCDCKEFHDQCSKSHASGTMCDTCSHSPSFMATCSCSEGYYRNHVTSTCSVCPDCLINNNSTLTYSSQSLPTECQSFTETCLKKCSHSGASQSLECTTCHRFISTWNCTQIETPGEQPAKRADSSAFRDYYVYIAAGAGVLLCTTLISTIVFMKRRRGDQKPMMPLWTIELKEEDQESFTDYNDMDVMYLDDSYLMEPSDVFTTSTDTMDERIGYKPIS